MLSFKEFLLEGGNVQITDASGKKQDAQRINLKELDRTKVIKSILSSLDILNKEFHFWKESVFKSKQFLSGSAKWLFDSELSTSDLLTFKPSFGDIDVTISEDKEQALVDSLTKSKGKTFGDLKLIGFKKTSGQIITLWQFLLNNQNIQIDFELSEYQNEEPTDWTNYSHSSELIDLKSGIKGIFQKKLYNALTAKDNKEITIKKGSRLETKSTNQLAFSVSKGLRNKYKKIEQDGKTVYQELSTKESNYIKDISVILELLLNQSKITDQEVNQSKSFIGLINLIKKYIKDPIQLKNIFNAFVYSLYSDRAQKLYKGKEGSVQDKEEKMKAIALLSKELNVKLTENQQSEIEKYYEQYK